MFHNRHLNDWKDYSQQQILEIIDLAIQVKNNPTEYSQHFTDKVLISLFEKTSTRTRLSSELSIREMGGQSLVFDLQKTNIGLTKIDYETEYMSMHAHYMLARLMKNETVLSMMKHSHASIINGCCDQYHPLQALADMITIYEQNHNSFKNVSLLYCGKYNNVTNSLMSICLATGIKLYFYCQNHDDAIIEKKSLSALKERSLFESVSYPSEVMKNVQFVYTDTWINMEFYNDPQKQEENKQQIKEMLPYQINAEMIQDYPVKIMHDMPIHANYEISEALVYDQRSIIFQQAQNRLYAQKAVMLYLQKLETQHKP